MSSEDCSSREGFSLCTTIPRSCASRPSCFTLKFTTVVFVDTCLTVQITSDEFYVREHQSGLVCCDVDVAAFAIADEPDHLKRKNLKSEAARIPFYL